MASTEIDKILRKLLALRNKAEKEASKYFNDKNLKKWEDVCNQIHGLSAAIEIIKEEFSEEDYNYYCSDIDK